jgi:hypothetical protein
MADDREENRRWENAGIARRLEVKLAWLGWNDLDFRRLAREVKVGSDAWLLKLANVIVWRLPRFVRRSGATGTMNVLADDRDKSIARFVDLYLTESKLPDSKVEAPKREMKWAVHEACKAFPGVSGKTVRNAHKRFGQVEPP